MKATISIITIVVLLSRSFNSTYASDRNDAIIAVGIGITVLSGIGFIYSVIYDIRQAPESARKYKESLYSSYPLKSDRPQVTGKIFGKPQFSRNALVNKFSP
ncbi:MAG: hypothetical protein GWN00_14855, partial [Aliifodinibius sp.]|nr:hypothetical protein [Fodinibius sp.]NIX01510.1 hypothetical protein [Phycisphaerae bacterium]NIY26036.1 hypothetical protein [Fodinibius sp.]